MKAYTRLRTSASVYSIYIVLALVILAAIGVVLGWSHRTVVALLVIAVTAHGFRVVRELGSARERERYIDALQVAIAERDAQTEILRAREELLIEAEQLATIGNFNWDIVNDGVYWSDELCRILGVPPGTSNANYEMYLRRVHPEDRDRVTAVLEQAVSSAEPFSLEHRWVRSDDGIRVIRIKARIGLDVEGRAARMIGVVQDITEQQATMAKLRRHEVQLAEAQKIAHIGSWDWNLSTNAGVWSAEMFRISGADPTTIPSFESYVALVHPEDRQRFLDEHAAVAAEQRKDISQDHRILRPDGGIIHVSLHTQFQYGGQGEVLSAVGTVQDITERKRIEESLRISEERFALAAKATNEVIWDWNAVTGRLWCNETFWSRYGYPEPADGPYGVEAWLNLLHPDDREPVWQSFQHAIAGGEQHWSTEYRVQTFSGEWLDVFDCGYLLRDDAGNVVRVIGASQDITDRKRATAELARMHQQNKLVLNSTVDAIIGADRDGRINFVNAAGTRMFGWSAEEMVGQSAHDLLHHSHPDGSPYPSNDCPARLNLWEGTAQRNTDVFWRKDGTAVPVEWTLSPIFADETAVGAVMTCTDITERLKIDRMKDEFVSTVSHELRTPLTAIRGAIGLLSSGRMGVFPAKAQRLLDVASTNTDRLVRLINDILDIEKLDSGKLVLSRRPTAVDGLIEQAVEGVRPLLDRARIAAIVESTSDVISIDPDRIMQTLTNLLSNAIKFSPDGSTILVTAERDGAEMRFSVTDEGRGIPSDKLEKIFERFEQVDASDSRNKGGSGLGLSICRSIVRQHGGTIHAESEPGRGSTFAFSIPASLAEIARSAATRRKVLVCENAPQAGVASMRTLLDQNGFEVRAVAPGEDLLEAVRNEIPDVVLLDLCAPENNGFEVLARMKNHPDTADVPVVIVSALAPEDIAERDGVCAWLPKPLTPETLLAALKCACDPNPKRKPRLLIVEDDPDLARVISTLFERYEVEVTLAATGREAIEFAREIRPDLLVLDLVLPDIDGFAVVHSLRTDDCCRNVPLLVYSAFEPSATQQEHLRLGPTEFLTKSRVSPEQLERRVAALLNTIIRERGDLFNAA